MIVVVTFTCVGVLGLVMHNLRRSAKASVLWGCFSFEFDEPLRAARNDLTKARNELANLTLAVKSNEEFLEDFYVLAASLKSFADDPTETELRRLLGLCAESAQRILGSNKASIWLHREATDRLHIYAGQKITTRTIRHFTLGRGEGFVGTVFASGKSECLDDVAEHPDKFVRDPYAHGTVTSIIGVPVFGKKNDPIGALCVSHAKPHKFDKSSFTYMIFYANLAAVALHVAMSNRIDLWGSQS